MSSLMRNEVISDTCMQQATISFCKHMFTLLDMVKKAHTLTEARASIRVINIAKLLFSTGLCIHVACPVDELFKVEYARVFAIVFDAMQGSALDMGASDTASDVSQDTEWDELQDDLQDEAATVTHETNWKYDRDHREWKPIVIELATAYEAPGPMSDDDSLAEEEEFLHGLAAARVQGVHQEKDHVGAPVEPPAPQQKKPSSHQPTLGLFFGNAVTKKYSTVRLPDGRVQRQLVSAEPTTLPTRANAAPSWASSCPNGCGKKFTHGPALTSHLKACFPNETLLPSAEPESEEEHQPVDEPEAGGSAGVDCDGLPEEEEPEENEEQQEIRGRKLRKNNMGFKQSGLREGEKRGRSYTIHFKFEVVQYYRTMQTMKQQGLIADGELPPVVATADRYRVTKGQVSAWAKLEGKYREALLHGNVVKGTGKRAACADKLVPFNSRAARRMTLHTGRKRPYAAAEAELYAIYKEKRAKGL